MKNTNIEKLSAQSIIDAAQSVQLPEIVDTLGFVKTLTKKAHYTAKKGGKKFVQFIDYTAQPECRRDYLYFLQSVKTVSSAILSKHSAMKMNGYNIQKFDTALKICNYVYFILCNDINSTGLQGKKRYYQKRDRVNLIISKVFDVFSNADGMLIDLLEIALEYIPAEPADALAIAKGTLKAKAEIDKFLEHTAKKLRDSISIDTPPTSEEAQQTITEISKHIYTQWAYNEKLFIEYDSENKTLFTDTGKFFDSMTARQLEVFTTYAGCGSLEKTGKKLGIKSKGAVADSIKKSREKFLQLIDMQTKLYLQEHYRLVNYRHITEPKQIAKYSSYRDIYYSKNGQKYIAMPFYNYLFDGIEYPHSHGFVTKHRKAKAGSAWYDSEKKKQYTQPVYIERVYDYLPSIWRYEKTRLGSVYMCECIYAE